MNIFRRFCKRSLFKNNFYRFGIREDIESEISNIKFENGKSLKEEIVKIDKNNEGIYSILIKLSPSYRKSKKLLSERLNERNINHEIKMAPKEVETNFQKKTTEKVKKIIAVYSCKGGVGKSTVALNLAYALKKFKNKKVGIFDADIYGPSLPTLVNKKRVELRADAENPEKIIPVEYEGVKLMSFGFVSPDKRAVIRGPMISNIISQLFYNTLWEDLDYLIVDMPPGTGDIQITLCQEVKFDGAVIITTPQNLSYVDVIKGIEMFDDLKVPSLSIIENMAYYNCKDCTAKHYLFGKGKISQIKRQFGIENSFEIPILEEVSTNSDLGLPPILTYPDSHQFCNTFRDIVDNLDQELDILEKNKIEYFLNYDTKQRLVYLRYGDEVKKIDPYELRIKCECALCYDEFSGKKILNDAKVDKEVHPITMTQKGNYAVAITWSDGHKSSIYPYKKLEQLFKKK